MQPTRLDIILPCYNPPQDWAKTLPEKVRSLQGALGPQVQITLILVNDGSKKGVLPEDIAFLHSQIAQFQYLAYQPNQGKGHALRQGVAIAKGEVQIYTDIDFPYTEASFLAVYAALADGRADLAAGVRDAEYYDHVPAARRVISKILRWMLRTFLRTKIADTQCGLKGFNAKTKAVFLETTTKRFLFDLEFIFLASKRADIDLKPVQVQLNPGIVFSKARLGILVRESFNFALIFWKALFSRK